jgi:F-type H+-transporting ATPase subunit delta
MADRNTIARPYAKAAFRHAQAASQLARWASVLQRGALTVTDARVAPLLGSPKATPEQLANLVIGVATHGIDAADEALENFLRTLAGNRRLGFLPEIVALFDRLKDEAEGTIDVTVTSAAALSAEQAGELSRALEARFGRKVRVELEVDPKLVGGAVLRAGDLVIDGSLKSRLERLAYELTV